MIRSHSTRGLIFSNWDVASPVYMGTATSLSLLVTLFLIQVRMLFALWCLHYICLLSAVIVWKVDHTILRHIILQCELINTAADFRGFCFLLCYYCRNQSHHVKYWGKCLDGMYLSCSFVSLSEAVVDVSYVDELHNRGKRHVNCLLFRWESWNRTARCSRGGRKCARPAWMGHCMTWSNGSCLCLWIRGWI